MSPQRIQRKRTKGYRLPPDAVYVGRPSRWGNPFRVGETYIWLGSTDLPFPLPTPREPGKYGNDLTVARCDAKDAVVWFVAWFEWMKGPNDIEPLRGHDLACWCSLSDPCHADVLLELANR